MSDFEAPGAGATGWEATKADVYRRLRESVDASRPAALAVVTDVEGSAYRRPGAKLVVTDDDSVGAITAGCLEGPVADLARDAIERGDARTETYDLTDDEDDSWGMGLGCNGVVDVLVDPIDDSLGPALAAVERKDRATVYTVLESEAAAVTTGDRTTVLDGGERVAEGRSGLPESVLEALESTLDGLDALSRSRTATVTVGGDEVTVFCDVFDPVPDLLVFGNQGDVRPVARLGREVGFHVRVVTGRGARADADRYPDAHEVRAVRAPDVGDAVEAPAHTYAVLMSHNFVDDRLALQALCEQEVPYVGLMGPRKRFEEMRDEFAAADEELSAADLDRISTPVGLDVGGDHPTQIAMSVVSEALAVRNGRSGGRLSERTGPVHPRED